MDFSAIAALGQEPTPSHLEPFITAYLEQHGPTKRGDLAHAIEDEWLEVAKRPLQADLMPRLKKALTHMANRGSIAQSGLYGVWRLPSTDPPDAPLDDEQELEETFDEELTEQGGIVVGVGTQLVYCFYLPAYRREAEQRGSNRWPIKIGRTTGSLANRLASLATAMPESPIVALVIQTHDADLLEKALQNVLSFRGRWLAEAAGSEWYLTNPDEIVRIFEFIRVGDGDDQRLPALDGALTPSPL
jgi:hypothetical protein